MNTRKQVLIMTALLFMMLVTVAVYAAWYPHRARSAEEHFEEMTSERGSLLFARNCRLCHGDVGEGGQIGARLPGAPVLDRPDLQGFRAVEDSNLTANVSPTATSFTLTTTQGISAGDILLIDRERMEVRQVNGDEITVRRGVQHSTPVQHFAEAAVYLLDTSAFDRLNPQSTMNVIMNTVTCGRVGTAMPAWGLEHGGPLNQEQIRQLTVLIMQARWELAEHHADDEDAVQARLTQPLSAETTSMFVDDVNQFEAGEAIRIGGERIRVTGVPELMRDRFGNLPPDRSGVLSIERGVLGTIPIDHSVEERIFRFPETPEPSILEHACGQTARAPAPVGPCATENGVLQISALGNAFNCSEIRVQADTQVRIAFENREAVPHNVAVYMSEDDLAPVAPGSVGDIFSGPGVTREVTFTAPPPGEYFFHCDVHPVPMQGRFIVQ